MSGSLAGLLAATERDGFDAAAAEFCERHGCRRPGTQTDWTFFLPVREDGVVLQLGAGAGDDTLRLASRARETRVAVLEQAQARLIEHRAAEAGLNVRPFVATDLSRLPLERGEIDAIAVDELSAAAFGLSQATLIAAAGEWRRVLSDGGSLLLASTNPLFRLPLAGRLWNTLRARSSPESLDQAIRRTLARSRRPDLALGAVLDIVGGTGFAEPTIYAPLPDARRPLAVLPVDEPAVARYFLTHMVRRNSWASRLAVGMASIAVDAGQLVRLVPDRWITWSAKGAA